MVMLVYVSNCFTYKVEETRLLNLCGGKAGQPFKQALNQIWDLQPVLVI